MPGADHLQQTGHAQRGIGAQFQRVQKFIVEPLEQAVHRLQSFEGFKEQAVVAHHQVAAFDQRQAQVARQVGVFKIGFVVRAGRQQHHTAFGDRAGGPHAVNQRAVSGGQTLHFHVAKGIREQQGNCQPIFQQVAQARRSLGALGHHRPLAVRTVGDVKCRNVQVGAARWLVTVHGAQVAGVAMHQSTWQQAVRQQGLWAVDIGHDTVQQPGALRHPNFDFGPVPLRHDHREQVQRPGPLRAIGICVNVVGHAVVTDFSLQVGAAVVQVIKTVGA